MSKNDGGFIPKPVYAVDDLCNHYIGKGKNRHTNKRLLSKPMLYKEIKAGRLRTFTVGRRRFVSHQALQNWIELLEKREPKP